MAIEKVEDKKETKKNNFSETIKSNEGKKVSIDPNEEVEEEEVIHAEFEEEAETNKFAAQSTKPNDTPGGDDIDHNTSIDDVRKGVEAYENSKSGKLEYKDLKSTAEFIITLLDTTMSTFFKILAKDTARQAYEMPAANKRLLVEQLALVLSKYQAKFKIEFMLFMGIIVLYAPMAIESIRRRKQSNKLSKKENKKIDSTLEKMKNIVEDQTKNINLQDQKFTENKTEENKAEENKVVEKTESPFVKKGRGRGKGAQPKV